MNMTESRVDWFDYGCAVALSNARSHMGTLEDIPKEALDLLERWAHIHQSVIKDDSMRDSCAIAVREILDGDNSGAVENA